MHAFPYTNQICSVYVYLSLCVCLSSSICLLFMSPSLFFSVSASVFLNCQHGSRVSFILLSLSFCLCFVCLYFRNQDFLLSLCASLYIYIYIYIYIYLYIYIYIS